MKRYILCVLFTLCGFATYGDDCDMPLRIIVPTQIEELDAASEQLVKNKLRQIVSRNGVVGGSDASPFALTAKVDVISKEVLSSMPTKYIYVLDVNLYIVDTQNQKIYSSTSIEVRCVGNSQTKAYVNGIKALDLSNAEVQVFIENGKERILDYYDNNYDEIIKEARTQATLRNYEEAIFYLMSVPACSKGYDLAMAEVEKVYQQYVDRQCDENLAQAQAAWLSGFTRENAAIAGIYLSEIYPDAACYKQAQALVNEIKKHMGEEWDFQMKQWDDLANIEEQRLKYSREIAIAFAKNQPDEVVDFIFR